MRVPNEKARIYKRLGISLVAVILLTFGLKFILSHVMIAMTNSVGHTLFYYEKVTNPTDVKKDKYVSFPLYSEVLKEECWPCKVTKKVGCDEGEILKSNNGQVYCGNTYLGFAKATTKKGQPLEHFNYNGPVPEGKFFAFGTNPDSFDSRYYGFIEKKKVVGIGCPIF